ncbi:hypothetical protein [Lentibacter sp.]|uniref:hypothetical protein n=1 Tax=Lentibacter sp. TaxID=2024994 RepID=UPI003F6CEE15
MSQNTPARKPIRTWSDWEKAVKKKQTTAAERALVDACRAGRGCTLGDGTRPTAPSDDRTIGADLLRYLIMGGCEGCDLHEWGVDLYGAYITGALDLRMVTAVGVTGLNFCHFTQGIDAMNARFEALGLSGSLLPSLNAQGAEVKGGVFLRNGFSAKGEVSFSGAQIGGQFECDNSTFENAEGDALNAQGAEVKGDVFLRNGFSAKGKVSLAGAQIGGQLSCKGGSFENEKEKEKALNVQGAEVKGSVFLRGGFSAKGEVSLSSAQICGQLDCTDGSFENENGHALNAQRAEVKGDVFLRGGFTAKGEVSLAGAQIGGELECIGGSFENEKEKALNAQGAEVKGSVFLSGGFTAKGEVSLSGAQISGQLSCTGGSFESEKEKALNAQGTQMSAFYWRDLKAVSGEINLAGARTGGLSDDAASWDMANRLYLDGFEYSSIHGPLDAPIRLAWLAKACAYDGSFSPLPYRQLAAVSWNMGQYALQRQILVEKQRRIFQTNRQKTWPLGLSFYWPINAIMRLWLWLLDRLYALIGYGYRPGNLAILLVPLFTAGVYIFHAAYEAGDFAPNSDVILSTPEWKQAAETESNPAKAWSAKGAAGADYETFNRYAYAADIVVPIIALGQEEAWAPSTTRGPWGWYAWWSRWVLKGMGWIVTALGAAAITGIIRRE